ncbi:hypothetical protein [Amorphus orientalis]|uniref:Uncharacterized protein n=1 Tax=Amorphus orientalis TaxID=649198 RepID=A0AAE4AUP0_9HYPH|nr:hypothetical protein [Amorphus orientalis]MDQ0317352.1 hypothetical protein [Amorphus orientalis]
MESPIVPWTQTPKQQREGLRAALDELSLSPAELADLLYKRGDYRDFQARIRSIQRMISGESRVSGEMSVICNMLLRQQRRLLLKYPDIEWKKEANGNYYSTIEDWNVVICPQSRGRWQVVCRKGPEPNGYSPPFSRYLSSLEEAKKKAPIYVEEGMNDIAEIRHLENIIDL